VSSGASSVLRALHVASEMAPLIKMGGLGDVVGALPHTMLELGIDGRILLPLWPGVLETLQEMGISTSRESEKVHVSLNWRVYSGEILSALVHGIQVYLLDQPELFQNPRIYPPETTEESVLPFVFLSYAALELEKVINWRPHVIHAHDWPGAFLPGALQWHRHYKQHHGHYDTVLTLHNMAHQCVVKRSALESWGFEPEAFSVGAMEFYGQVNVLKGGINAAGAVTTVSPQYSWEIQTMKGGFGLDGVLIQNRSKLRGILNGIDYEIWNPAEDPHLPKPYTAKNLGGKRACRKALLERTGLPEENRPIFIFVSRLVEQKGIDLILGSMEALLKKNIQLLILGSGHEAVERAFQEEVRRFPGQVWLHTGFSEPLAHLLYAGGDFLLMPSLFEPCGLSQLIAMRYGTIPVVRAVGGLSDTVLDVEGAPEDGNGFVFLDYSGEELLKAVSRGLALYDKPKEWKALVSRNMEVDFSWRRSARLYQQLYNALLEGTPVTLAV